MALLDYVVPLSFGGFGYRRRATRFDESTREDVAGKKVVVTGATSGLGRAGALALARLGAEVHVVGRSEAGLAEVARAAEGHRVVAHRADLSCLGELQMLASRLTAHAPIDVLIHNAGVLLDERTLTEDGLETSFATNVLAGFVLTRALADALTPRTGRVINVTSGGMYLARLDVDALAHGPDPWDGTKAYALHKRAQVVLTELWAERLAPRGVRVDAYHPGWADTAGVSRSLPRFRKLLGPWLRSAEEGADTMVYLASHRLNEPSGSLWLDRQVVRKHIASFTETSPGDAERLFSLCEELASRRS